MLAKLVQTLLSELSLSHFAVTFLMGVKTLEYLIIVLEVQKSSAFVIS